MLSRATCLLIGLLALSGVQGQGIDFIDNDLAKALDIAARSNKPIFIDAYTTWCAPCKQMDKEVFVDSAVGRTFNQEFVNLKLDMEQGDGPSMARRYQVAGYPSFLFIDSSKRLLHRAIGFHTRDRLLALAKQALNPKRQLGTMEAAYNNGDRSKHLLYHYAMALANNGDKRAGPIGSAYLQDEANWATKKNMDLIVRLIQKYDDPYYNFLLEKRYLFYKEYGQGPVNSTIRRMLESHLIAHIDEIDLKETREIYLRSFPASKAIPFYDLFAVNYYDIIGDKASYIAQARSYIKKYPTLSWNILNEISWNFYEKVDDAKALKWATKWAKKSVSQNSNHFNNDTLAALYYKQGNRKKAEKYALRAVELAKAAGSPFDETTKLLEQIRAL